MGNSKNVNRDNNSVLGGAIFVGLGGTGTEILRRMKNLMENTFLAEKESRPFKILLLDTDERGKADLGEDIHSLYLGGFSPERMVQFKRDLIKNWWWPDDRWLPLLPRVEDGAGEIRLLGRMAFYLKKDYLGKVIESYADNLKDFLSRLKDSRATNATIKIDTFIVGSFAGGTGSSMFNDVAAAIQYVLKNKGIPQPQITGIFLTGDAFENVIDEGFLRERVKANTFGALAEYFYDRSASKGRLRPRLNPLAINMPNSKSKYIDSRNFTNLILIQNINKHGDIAALNDLYEFVASSLYTIAADYGRIASSGKNISTVFASLQTELPYVLSSMGAYSIYYPKDTVKNYASKRVLSKMIPSYFYDTKQNAHEAEEKDVDKAADDFLNNILRVGYSTEKGDKNFSIIKDITKRLKGNENLFFNGFNFSGIINAPNLRSAEEKLNKMQEIGEKTLSEYKAQLQSLFDKRLDDFGNEIPTIVDEKIDLFEKNIKDIYTSKDFGYLKNFLVALNSKLSGSRGLGKVIMRDKNKSDADASSNGPAAIRTVFNKYDKRWFLGENAKIKYLKKQGCHILERHYRERIKSITLEYAANLIQMLIEAVSKELDIVKAFGAYMEEINEKYVKPDVAAFVQRFNGAERVSAAGQSVLYGEEIVKLVEKNYPSEGEIENAYKEIAGEIYENFKNKYISETKTRKSDPEELKTWLKDNIFKLSEKFSHTMSKLSGLSIYDATREVYDTDEETMQILKERIAKLKEVTPFVNLDSAVRDESKASVRGYLSLPEDNTETKIDQRWLDITEDLLNDIAAREGHNIQKIQSPNKQIITISIIEGGISPLSITAWDNYTSSYKLVVGSDPSDYTRDKDRIPVLADYKVERSIDKVVSIMETGHSKKSREDVLEKIALGYALGNIIEKKDLSCSIRMLHELKDDYWKKFTQKITDAQGNEYYEFTPPDGYDKNLHTLYKYLSDNLSADVSIIAELDTINLSTRKQLGPRGVEERLKRTLSKLENVLKTSTYSEEDDELIGIYQRIRDLLEEHLYYIKSEF